MVEKKLNRSTSVLYLGCRVSLQCNISNQTNQVKHNLLRCSLCEQYQLAKYLKLQLCNFAIVTVVCLIPGYLFFKSYSTAGVEITEGRQMEKKFHGI